MRLILTILLIGLFKADAQMIINASAPYRPLGGFSGLLDDYSGAAAAYSLRKLDKDYTGAAIRVRKDTTGQPEQDVFFTASGDLDTSAIKTFLNARNGFVVTWYDQSGNDRNATQATAARQPRIANLGVIDRRLGEPSVFFDGGTNRLSTASFADIDGNYTVFASTFKLDSLSRYILSHASSTTPNANEYLKVVINIPRTEPRIGTIFRNDDGSRLNITDNYLLTALKTATTLEVFVNNTTNGSTTITGNANNTNNPLTIGAYRNDGQFHFRGNMHEIIFYGSDKSSDRVGIQNNINSYYGIY